MTRAVPAPLAACAAWFCACSTPTPQIVLALADPPACTFTACDMVSLPCGAVMSIRIVEPGDPTKRYLDQCVRVPRNKQNNVCALAQIELASVSLPVRDLAVQIAVFPGSAVPPDASGELICPNVAYSSAAGFPVEEAPAPALGRQVFYHPGDTTVKVALGCTDLSAVQAGESCNDPAAGAATATVDDFDTQEPVAVGQGGIAEDLFVWSGEPHLFRGGYVLHPPPDVVTMRLDDDGTPHWTAETAQTFESYACIEVLEDAPQAVATLHCAPAADRPAELTGYWLLGKSLQAVLGGSGFPETGITIGKVVDATTTGAANVVVNTSLPAHITYLDNGVFVSSDAPFGTVFSAPGAQPAVGGLVAGKATIVVLPPMAP